MASDSKPPSPYKHGNIDERGDYKVGRGRPPKESQFKVGDGRKRGRRPKGQRNFDTEFEEEARRLVTIKEGGKERRVSKMRSTIIRAFDNAASKGDNTAIATLFQMALRMTDKRVANTRLDPAEDALLDAWIEDQLGQRNDGGNPGDPVSPADSSDDPDQAQENGDG